MLNPKDKRSSRSPEACSCTPSRSVAPLQGNMAIWHVALCKGGVLKNEKGFILKADRNGFCDYYDASVTRRSPAASQAPASGALPRNSSTVRSSPHSSGRLDGGMRAPSKSLVIRSNRSGTQVAPGHSGANASFDPNSPACFRELCLELQPSAKAFNSSSSVDGLSKTAVLMQAWAALSFSFWVRWFHCLVRSFSLALLALAS